MNMFTFIDGAPDIEVANFVALLPKLYPLFQNNYTYALNNPLKDIDPLGLISCDGTWWQMASTPGFIVVVNYCRCFWLCVPCHGHVWWTGNPYNLPSTDGHRAYNGGGGLKTGDTCMCNKPGPEKDCSKCKNE